MNGQVTGMESRMTDCKGTLFQKIYEVYVYSEAFSSRRSQTLGSVPSLSVFIHEHTEKNYLFEQQPSPILCITQQLTHPVTECVISLP